MYRTTHILVFALMLFAGGELLAQAGQYKRNSPDFFPPISEYAPKGWYITPGVTYMAGIDGSDRRSLGGDTIQIQVEEPQGQVGAFLQVGRFHGINSRWLTYIDYGVDLRWLRGLHNRRVETRLGADNPEWMVAEGGANFSDLWLGVSFNATLAKPLSKTVFLHHSFGINANYAVLRSSNVSPLHEATTVDAQPSDINGQLHYKLGVGFKLGRGWYIIPTVETPIIGVYDWNGAIPSLKYFDTYYQPILFGITIMKSDRRKPEDCPTEAVSGGKNKKTGLWDKKMR